MLAIVDAVIEYESRAAQKLGQRQPLLVTRDRLA